MIKVIYPICAKDRVYSSKTDFLDAPKDGIKLEMQPEMWDALNEICWREQKSIHAVCTAVYMTKNSNLPLEKAVPLFIFDYFRRAATEEGHQKAGHGYCPALKSERFLH